MRPELLHHVVQYLHQDILVLIFCDYYMFVHKMNKVDFEVLICFIISLQNCHLYLEIIGKYQNDVHNIGVQHEVKKKYAIFFRHTFHWIFRKYMVEWERKISWMVELACKIRKASLTVFIDDQTIAVLGCYERYKVTSLAVMQSSTPYYEMEYFSTDNIMTYFPY